MRALVLIVLCCALLAVPGFASANIVFNGGFETGDFTGWILSGNPIPGNVDASSPHSGQFAANLFAAQSPAFIEQQLATQPGAIYRLTYFFESDGETPNRFSTQINGSILIDQTDLPAQSYAAQSFVFTATSMVERSGWEAQSRCSPMRVRSIESMSMDSGWIAPPSPTSSSLHS